MLSSCLWFGTSYFAAWIGLSSKGSFLPAPGVTGHLQAQTRVAAPSASQLCALLSVLLDHFLELPTMQQGQRRQAASQAGVHCTAVTTERQTELRFLCPVKDTKPTAGSEVPVTPGMQTSPF